MIMTARKYTSNKARRVARSRYPKIASIDGRHPLQDQAPGTYVSYQARLRKRGKVCYFNFDLAKEVGIVAQNHSYGLNEELCNVLLDTFGIIIINEFDIINNKKFDDTEIKENFYMATRYLQMQHKSRIGLTSGDGRGVWNGTVETKGRVWDVTSNGTGATCLSPAAANNNIFYESGDPSISYGCGYAELQDAIGNSIFSEILHNEGIPTERTLCIIEYPGSFCVAVRVGENLLRPSHFFNHLKQNHYRRLKNVFDLFIDRETQNKSMTLKKLPMKKRYDAVLEKLAIRYAKMCALFEREYIFCWLDWDGDNMLANGGIIDYGSIRQLGMCHHQYRFDDDVRWSTNLLEQRQKGRYIIQTFCQLIDFLKTGVKKNREKFRNHSALKLFDKVFEQEKKIRLVEKVGFDRETAQWLYDKHPRLVQKFHAIFEAFERQGSVKGEVPVADGVARHAVFNMRSLLRELPEFYLHSDQMMDDEDFMELMHSSFANKSDMQLTRSRSQHIAEFQRIYHRFVEKVSRKTGLSNIQVLQSVRNRSARINRSDRVTGDGMYFVGEALYKMRKRLSPDEWNLLIREFIQSQNLNPETGFVSTYDMLRECKSSTRQLKTLLDIVKTYREGL